MKKLFIPSGILLSILGLFIVSSIRAQPTKPSKSRVSKPQVFKPQVSKPQYDLAWLPISDDQIKAEILNRRDDPMAMHQLMRRAAINSKLEVMHDALKPLAESEMHEAQPQYPLLLAAYVATFSINLKKKIGETDLIERDKMIDQAMQAKKHLWYAYMVKGNSIAFNNPPASLFEQIKWLEKSVAVAPDFSFNRLALATAYDTAASNISNKEKVAEMKNQSIEQRRKAYTLKPLTTHSCAAMYAYYQWYAEPPDSKRASTYAQKMAQLIPPGAALDEEMRRFLSDFGLTVSGSGKTQKIEPKP